MAMAPFNRGADCWGGQGAGQAAPAARLLATLTVSGPKAMTRRVMLSETSFLVQCGGAPPATLTSRSGLALSSPPHPAPRAAMADHAAATTVVAVVRDLCWAAQQLKVAWDTAKEVRAGHACRPWWWWWPLWRAARLVSPAVVAGL